MTMPLNWTGVAACWRRLAAPARATLVAGLVTLGACLAGWLLFRLLFPFGVGPSASHAAAQAYFDDLDRRVARTHDVSRADWQRLRAYCGAWDPYLRKQALIAMGGITAPHRRADVKTAVDAVAGAPGATEDDLFFAIIVYHRQKFAGIEPLLETAAASRSLHLQDAPHYMLQKAGVDVPDPPWSDDQKAYVIRKLRGTPWPGY